MRKRLKNVPTRDYADNPDSIQAVKTPGGASILFGNAKKNRQAALHFHHRIRINAPESLP